MSASQHMEDLRKQRDRLSREVNDLRYELNKYRNYPKILRALEDLLEQIDCLDGIEYTKDLEPYKAEAVWNDVLNNAQEALKLAKP